MESSASSDHGRDRGVLLTVGGYPYKTTRSTLLASHHEKEKQTYFHAILSDRWMVKQSEGPPSFDIPDRDGDIFFYILYYLRMGQLPRITDSTSHYESPLSFADREKLLIEVDYYGLQGLAQLCRESLDLLRDFPPTGDFDLSPYSDFSVIIETCRGYSYRMQYKFNGVTNVLVNLIYFCRKLLFELTTDNGTALVDKKALVSTSRHVHSIIAKIYGAGKSKREQAPTVSEVLADVPTAMIPPEARVWWAM